MCFLPCTLLISVWHCRGSGVRLGHDFKLLLQPSAPQAAITAINTVMFLLDFKSNRRRMNWVKKGVCKTFLLSFHCCLPPSVRLAIYSNSNSIIFSKQSIAFQRSMDNSFPLLSDIDTDTLWKWLDCWMWVNWFGCKCCGWRTDAEGRR